MRGLLATKGTHRATFAAACLLALAALIVPIAGRPKAQGQLTGPTINMWCDYNSPAYCDDCNSVWQPQFGCTSPPPMTWGLGACTTGPGQCTQWANYICGVEVECGFGNPILFNCTAAATLCR